jgi:formate/nitrite transporter FocA (FNT family)
MDYVAPPNVMEQLTTAGTNKAKLPVRDLLVRGMLSGALLGFATTLAFTASTQLGKGIAGAIIFPVGFVMIVLLGLELVTGNFALVPLGLIERRISLSQLAANWTWVFVGNLLGCLLYAVLFVLTTTSSTAIGQNIVQIAAAKTTAYKAMGSQ